MTVGPSPPTKHCRKKRKEDGRRWGTQWNPEGLTSVVSTVSVNSYWTPGQALPRDRRVDGREGNINTRREKICRLYWRKDDCIDECMKTLMIFHARKIISLRSCDATKCRHSWLEQLGVGSTVVEPSAKKNKKQQIDNARECFSTISLIFWT